MVFLQKAREGIWCGWLGALACSLGAACSLTSSWHAPALALRCGGMASGALFLAAMVTVATPTAVLQLAVGALSHAGPVAMWRAVPFFRGVGYLRLLTSLLLGTGSALRVGFTASYLLHSVSVGISTAECKVYSQEEGWQQNVSASACPSNTSESFVYEQLEYSVAVGLLVIAVWIAFPFLLYKPKKVIRKTFYLLGPTVVILGSVIVGCIGSSDDWAVMMHSEWEYLLSPDIWIAALTQSLLASQVAGGYLILAGDAIYANTDVRWTSMSLTALNVVASWAGVAFWFSVIGAPIDQRGPGNGLTFYRRDPGGASAMLDMVYQAAERRHLAGFWPALVFFMMVLSGIITLCILVFPLYDWCEGAGLRGRLLVSAVGIPATLGVLGAGAPALALLEGTTVPLLTTLATVLEISAISFIYGWKYLKEDIRFLNGVELSKGWVIGWFIAPALTVAVTLWWIVDVFIWSQDIWRQAVMAATAAATTVVFAAFAGVSVHRQDQYDCLGKLKSSFKPSRHWGPRDPITHYYWLARRKEYLQGNRTQALYYRRQLGQLFGRPSFLHIESPNPSKDSISDLRAEDVKRRTKSDDFVYTGHRRALLSALFPYLNPDMNRSNSISFIPRARINNHACLKLRNLETSEISVISLQKENNNHNRRVEIQLHLYDR